MCGCRCAACVILITAQRTAIVPAHVVRFGVVFGENENAPAHAFAAKRGTDERRGADVEERERGDETVGGG